MATMQVKPTSIEGILILKPRRFSDERGWFMESFNHQVFNAALQQHGQPEVQFVQDNHSWSHKGVLRGLHYQLNPHAQGKLVRVIQGKTWEIIVDIRQDSTTFGKWLGMELSSNNHSMLWIPPGFAHGFISLEDNTQFLYKTTDYFAKEFERSLLWNDPKLAIEWPLDTNSKLIISVKDQNAMTLAQAIQEQALF